MLLKVRIVLKVKIYALTVETIMKNPWETKSDSDLIVHSPVIEGGIAQAVPEHPKRDNIFSLSTACGDAYLFQVRNYRQLSHGYLICAQSGSDSPKM